MRILILTIACATVLLATDTQWVLEKSTLTYHVSHPLHESEGVSHAAKGKAICRAGQCQILVAVPVKSFESGDTNRDLHMLQVTKGSAYPLVSVRTRISEQTTGQFLADLDIEFAGQTAHYQQVPFTRDGQAGQTRITGSIPLKLSDFKIEPPSLLTVAVKNEVPLKVDLSWRTQ
jgi:hypothetical protein